MKRVWYFFESMTGRIFLILLVGMVGAALIATAITGMTSERQFAQQLLDRTADDLEAYIDILDAIPMARPIAREIFGVIRIQGADTETIYPDRKFRDVLTGRGGVLSTAQVYFAEHHVCFPELYGTQQQHTPEYQEHANNFWERPEVQKIVPPILERLYKKGQRDPTVITPPTCRLIDIRFSDGSPYRFSIDTPWIQRKRSPMFDPVLLILLVFPVGILAYFIARIASVPLNRLAEAATQLGEDLDRAAVAVSGPTEVRKAALAFNSMQRRLQQHIGERTQLLAAITHDLQTPLTRLRLRLERINDEALKERLVADLGAMSALIDEGLELARSAETSEPQVQLDLDSLLESLVEDAVDAGAEALFEQGCKAVIQLRPLGARRMLSNLIDNAIKYGGCALVSAVRHGNTVSVYIRDRGPGLPPEMLERVFDPFVRMENSRSRDNGGTGLGLTIARKLAKASGATLTLHNRPEGGLEVVVRWKNVEPISK